MTVKAEIKGVRNLLRDIDARDKKSKKALETAIKVEGFQQLKKLRAEVRAGTPAGRAYAAQLSAIARRTKRGTLKKNQIPLYRLARLLRYRVAYMNGDLRFSFGFVNSRNASLSSSYKDLLIKHQEGVDVLYKGSRTELGRRLARIGGRLKKRGDPDAKFFFLRKTTGRKIDIPQRDIINPFMDRYRPEMAANIRRNYRRKMAGERI